MSIGAQDWLLTEQGETLADDLGILLRDLVVGWGFSVWELRGRDIVRNGNGIVTGDAVARAVLQGEGDDPQSRPRGFRAIGRLFHYRYGAQAIAAGDYVPGAYVPYSGVPLPDVAEAPEPDDILQRLRALRSGYRLGAEEEQAAHDMRALILLHEKLTGRSWN